MYMYKYIHYACHYTSCTAGMCVCVCVCVCVSMRECEHVLLQYLGVSIRSKS